jgi:uncharacterized phiE125 gp8 family phage protein
MTLFLVTPPASEPLSLLEAQAHLRLDASNLEPAPVAPLVALASAGAGNVDEGVHRYRVTFVTADGETEGGVPSSAVTISDQTTNGQVAVTMIPLGGPHVLARKLYRTLANGAEYFLLATLDDNATTTYSDDAPDVALGVGCPTLNTTGDPYLLNCIATAREDVEAYCRRALIRQTWRLVLDGFPACDEIALRRPPLLGVVAVNYLDLTNTQQLLDDTVYEVDPYALPPRLLLGYQQFWPPTFPKRNAVSVDFECGYGDSPASVPQSIRTAMKLIVGDLYENREPYIKGTIINESPTLRRLLTHYRYKEMV